MIFACGDAEPREARGRGRVFRQLVGDAALDAGEPLLALRAQPGGNRAARAAGS